jgi:hypothetical protein
MCHAHREQVAEYLAAERFAPANDLSALADFRK